MQKNYLTTIIILILLSGCDEQKSSPSTQINKDSLHQQTFFPVTDYIRGQLNEIDSLPVTPLLVTSFNGKVDSAWKKRGDIRTFAEPFLHPVIDTSNFKELFIEKSFLDQTINAFTFSYDPVSALPDTLQLTRWDVSHSPGEKSSSKFTNPDRREHELKEVCAEIYFILPISAKRLCFSVSLL